MPQDGHASCTTAQKVIRCQAPICSHMYSIQDDDQLPEESTMHAGRDCVLDAQSLTQ